MPRIARNETIVLSAIPARSNFAKLLRLAPPEPDVLKLIGEESQRKGTHKMTTREIDRVIKTSRMQKTKRG
jgi:hypothetical protein